MTSMEGQTLAAIDLGSNSFHLVVARVIDGQLVVQDRVKERVRLAAGIDSRGRLDAASRVRALAALRRFRDRLEAVHVSRVRAVGTNTLRKASHDQRFLYQASTALGHPIDIVSGHEEARLVYQGVAHELEDDGGQRLVVDIGGGSTECIVGESHDILRADSLFMGCVSFTRRFFGDGRITHKAMRRAVLAARHELESVAHLYRELGWENCYGSSGTIKAIQTCLDAYGWADHAITRPGLKLMRGALRKAGTIDDIHLEGVSADRAQVIAGGVAVLSGVFKALDIKRMVASDGALREGVLLDMAGPHDLGDVRDAAVRRMRTRYHVDVGHARQVMGTALYLFGQVQARWGLDPKRGRNLLRWGSHLREVGKSISYTGYHRHGAYLVQHSHMPGFARGTQARLAAIILCQRRKMSRERVLEMVGKDFAEATLRLALVLRIAARLHRTPRSEAPPGLLMEVDESSVALHFPAGWLEHRPLALADLEDERRHFAGVGYRLTW